MPRLCIVTKTFQKAHSHLLAAICCRNATVVPNYTERDVSRMPSSRWRKLMYTILIHANLYRNQTNQTYNLTLPGHQFSLNTSKWGIQCNLSPTRCNGPLGTFLKRWDISHYQQQCNSLHLSNR